jgi:integrase
MVSKASNGRGSIYHRKDGRYQVAVRMTLPDGTSKRVYTTVRSKAEAEERLHEQLELNRRGIPTPARSWRVDDYLDYWLQEVVSAKNRPKTVELYEMYLRVYIRPALGRKQLRELSVKDVQTLLNRVATDRSIRLAHGTRSVLRAALNRAMREELLPRNVAALTELPAWRRKAITPWSVAEANRFLMSTNGSPLHLPFQLLLTYGMRRGEVLGLRWADVDFEGCTIAVEQQLQRLHRELVVGPVKTDAGRRLLPLLPLTSRALLDAFKTAQASRARTADELITDGDLVFVTSSGRPFDPDAFSDSFQRLRERAGVRRITVHHLRHTAATMLKNLGVPARDAQLILGHAQITTTQELYQHGDLEGQARAISMIERQLSPAAGSRRGGQNGGQTNKSPTFISDFIDSTSVNSGGPAGDRTLDILLKSLSGYTLETLPTSVFGHLRALTRAHRIGAVVVKSGGQLRPAPATHDAADSGTPSNQLLSTIPRREGAV